MPYPDESFDLYISSLSLMLVNNHKNQISEAYRVLETGGTAGLTVPGRMENCTFFMFFFKLLQEAGIKTEEPKRPNQTIGADKDALVQDFKDAGFSTVRAYYTFINPGLGSPEDYFNFFIQGPTFRGIYQDMTEERKSKFKELFDRLFEETFPQTGDKGPEWEILVISATK